MDMNIEHDPIPVKKSLFNDNKNKNKTLATCFEYKMRSNQSIEVQFRMW